MLDDEPMIVEEHNGGRCFSCGGEMVTVHGEQDIPIDRCLSCGAESYEVD